MDSYDFEITKGSSFGVSLTVKDFEGIPLNLSGYNVRSTLRHRFGETGKLTDFFVSILTPESGLIFMSLSPATTINLPITQGVYDVEVYNGNETDVFKVLNGYAVIIPEVS